LAYDIVQVLVNSSKNNSYYKIVYVKKTMMYIVDSL